MLKVKILPGGFPLYKKHGTDAGYDMSAPEDFNIYPQSSAFVDLKVAVKIPEGWVGLLTHRSSMAVKLETAGSLGVIDSDYTGSIRAKLFNHGDDLVKIKKGERIVQLVVVPFHTEGIEYVTELDKTERGDGGFGSTNKCTSLISKLEGINDEG